MSALAPESPPPARLAVTRLRLTDFRCYAALRLDAGPEPVVLTGPNGAGKTNLLEAVSFLAPGRGLRRARAEEPGRMVPGEAAPRPWAVAATVDTPLGPREVGSGLERRPGRRDRRRIRLDGQDAGGQAALAEVMAAVWLTPALDRLFVEGAAGRRRFLDRLVMGGDPAHAGRLTAYERALRERARLLRAGTRDPAWLAALEREMAGRGVAVAAARREAVAALARAATAGGRGVFPVPGVALAGWTEERLAAASALAVEEALAGRLAAARARDAETGGAADGPHRSDLRVVHRGRADTPAERCSTGEQKALLIALILAQARVLAAEAGLVPVMLLDEVAAHLDARRRAALFEEILGLGAQAWLTGTDRELFAGLRERARFLHVEEARVFEAHPGASDVQ